MFASYLIFPVIIGIAGSAMAEEAQIDWKTLPEYMAMDRNQQRHLILHTRRLVMRKLAQTDFGRAECVAGLFDVTEEGHEQYYNLKGFMNESTKENLFPGWKAQQIAAWVMKTHLCPEKAAASATSK